MDAFKADLKKRITWFAILFAAAAAFVAIAGTWGARVTSTDHLSNFMRGVPVGSFTAIAVIPLISIIRMIRILNDPEKLRALYVRENDERTQLIRAKALTLGFWVTAWSLIVAMTVASFLSSPVALTLFCVLSFMAVIKVALMAYYQKKY